MKTKLGRSTIIVQEFVILQKFVIVDFLSPHSKLASLNIACSFLNLTETNFGREN